MKEYKMRRGETLGERIPDMEATVEDYFDPITGTEEFKGSDLYIVGEPRSPVFTHIVTGVVKYSGEKDKLAVNFEEASLADLTPGDPEVAGEAVSTRNNFLLEATGHDTKSRRDSMRRVIEDDTSDV